MLAATDAPAEADRLTRHCPAIAPDDAFVPADVWRGTEALYVQFDLPGVDRSSIELTVECGTLTLVARRTTPVPADARPVLVQRPAGRFTRCLHLSDALDIEAAEVAYDNGVLTLRIPLAAHAEPRKIILSGGAPKRFTVRDSA
ncbi:Hsp20/alpha crystallin family protein [Streptomyces sp. NPDC006367]|uniref:Hsp20/alpha crystallin family protein n=1 Tax=unclassified Streptomyces TaxID=2593676 RepID=UPI0033ADDB22